MNFMNKNLEEDYARETKQALRFPDSSYFPGHWNQCYNFSANNKTGHWSEKQNAKYYAFLKKFQDKFSEKESRRHWKVFKSLAEFIKTRDPNQCRSHHHKMKKNFQGIEETLEFLRTKQPGLQKRSEKYLKELENMDFNDFGKPTNDVPSNNNGRPAPENEEKFKWELDNDFEVGAQNFGSLNYFQMGKMGDIANKKTNAGYQENEIYGKDQNEQYLSDFSLAPEVFIPTYNGFPSTGLLGSQRLQEKKLHPKNDSQFKSAFESFYEKNEQENAEYDEARTQKVLQCQYYFNRWMSALENLVQDEQNAYE